MKRFRKIYRNHVRVGDWADRIDGSLDPRQVAEVDHQGPGNRWVRLQIGDTVTAPIPASFYTFTREVR